MMDTNPDDLDDSDATSNNNNGKDEENSSGESSSTSAERTSKLEPKLCLCRSQNFTNQLVYISKFDMIEIEYKIKLGDRETIKANSFLLKYEFIDRGCEQLVKLSSKSSHKGRFKNSLI